jgi:ribonuclease G
MSKELVIGSSRHETKVAILEDDQLVELYFQRGNEYSLAGSIHKGRVTRVLPGMQSAFVDLGLERDTFLYVSDFFEENEDIDTVEEKPSRPDRGDRRDRGPRRGPERAPISAAPEVQVPEPPAAEQVTEQESPAGPSLVPAATAPSDEGDRGFRDRRGRRSRRRRQRGRGFPENKYAQSPASQEQSAEPELREETEPPSPADVIVLPGESLAKYRHKAEDARKDEIPAEPVTETAEQEAVEAEAEELELADKVFAHHEDESSIDEEEKIEELKHDHFSPDDETPSNEAPSQEMAAELSEMEGISAVDLSEARLDMAPTGEAVDDVDEFETNGQDEPPEESIESAPGETAEASATTRPQSASVRDQSGRYMHRMSRRMRRRRGGNRFAQGAELGTAASAGAGAAAAPAPESDTRREPVEERWAEKPDRALPSISDLLKAGQEIIVQIAKEPLGQKGARITSHVALPGRYVVFMPSVSHLGVSRKVASDEERQRLKRILQTHRVGTTGGFIVRTAGEGVPEEEIAADMNFLYSLWLDIRQKAEQKPAPVLLHYDLDIVQRVLRDQLTDDFKAVWVDNEEMYENVLNFLHRFQPALVNRVKMYTRPAPIFDAFKITQELEKALRPKVWLKSGGYIVINQTEALVAIDINTGKYVGKSNRLEDTIVKTNTEAVKEIVRQIRLRDLGGIIVVDFIDMDERKNRQKVMQALEEAMRADRAPYKILQFNDFGLVAITRKRVKQSLERTLCAPCPYCEGAGYVKSVQTIIGEILVEAQKIARAIEGKDVVLRAHPDVAKVLKASTNRYLEELEEVLGRPVLVTGDPSLHHEKFDLA